MGGSRGWGLWPWAGPGDGAAGMGGPEGKYLGTGLCAGARVRDRGYADGWIQGPEHGRSAGRITWDSVLDTHDLCRGALPGASHVKLM